MHITGIINNLHHLISRLRNTFSNTYNLSFNYAQRRRMACIKNIFVRIVGNLAAISKFSTSVCLIVLGVIMRFTLFSYRFPSLMLINLDISNCL